jgi:hypothetical protein
VRANRTALAVVAGLMLLVAAAPDDSERHVVAGHFTVPTTSPSAAPTATAGNVVTNPSFETGKVDGGWHQCGDVGAYVMSAHPHSGAYEEYSGTLSGAEPRGNSGVCQAIRIPPGAMLSAQLYQISNEPDTTYAYQEADLLDEHGSVVVTLYKTVNNKAAWVQGTWNLGAYAGKTYWLYFGVHGDGYSKLTTQQFLDEVILTGSSSTGHE